MIDWHSHVLPAMDDGSQNTAESISLIEAQASQGVGTVIATPHFYANDESVESFLDRRRESFSELKKALPDGSPDVILGAEVRYYQGISRLPNLKELRIGESKLLLLEMPVARWTEYMIRELIELSGMSGIRLVLAHIDRYVGLQKFNDWVRLRENGVLMQVNASFFSSILTKRKAISFLQDDIIQFIGSDCHNLTARAPQIGKAFDVIQKKLGDDYLSQMTEYGYSMLGHEYNYNF